MSHLNQSLDCRYNCVASEARARLHCALRSAINRSIYHLLKSPFNWLSIQRFHATLARRHTGVIPANNTQRLDCLLYTTPHSHRRPHRGNSEITTDRSKILSTSTKLEDITNITSSNSSSLYM